MVELIVLGFGFLSNVLDNFFVFLGVGMVNFFCKGLEGNYIWFCRLYNFCYYDLILLEVISKGVSVVDC